MKKTKKMLALMLALMMAFTTLVMPAMAAGEDAGIMPLYEATTCPDCGREARVSRYHTGPQKVPAFDCDNIIFPHEHDAEDVYVIKTVCMYCPYDEELYFPYGVTCPHAK